MTDDAPQDAEKNALAGLKSRIEELYKAEKFDTMNLLIAEALPLARCSGEFDSLVEILFTKANAANSTLRPRDQREACVELVTLLSSIDLAREIQPNLEEAEYTDLVNWYTSCAYDNLATATANLEGYNSEGMYEAVNEGIEKCRQTGKFQCITCFREYATQVSLAADDLALAARQANLLAQRPKEAATHDRRTVAWGDLAYINLLGGNLDQVIHCEREAWKLAAEFHNPSSVRFRTHINVEIAALLRGRPEDYQDFCRDCPPEPTHDHENASDFLKTDKLKAIRAACAGDYKTASEVHESWASRLWELGNINSWFEQSLHATANRLLSGESKEPGSPLAERIDQLRREAENRRDWLTLRRLKALLDPERRINPIASVEPFVEGPFADPKAVKAREAAFAALENREPPQADAAEEPSSARDPEPEKTEAPGPFEELFKEWIRKLEGAGPEGRSTLEKLAADLAKTPASAPESERDAFNFLRATYLAVSNGIEVKRLWPLARMIARRFPSDATINGILADIADLRSQLAATGDSKLGITESAEEATAEARKLYKTALALDVSNPGVYFNAGVFYQRIGELGEAERCFARAFRLDRSWKPAAMSLAEVYRDSGRFSDAAEVLDLALRSGCLDPELAWQAGLSAFSQGLWRRAATIFELFSKALEPEAPWARYYLSAALFEVDDFAPALQAINEELARNPDAEIMGLALQAACHQGLGESAPALAILEQIQKIPFGGADKLNPSGLRRALLRAWNTARKLENTELAQAFEKRALRAGVALEEAFSLLRKSQDESLRDDVGVYAVTFDQDLPETWRDDPDCPNWELDTRQYRVEWQVLCKDEESARRLAEAMQSQAAPIPPNFVSVSNADPDRYRDRPGILEQGPRESSSVQPD